MTHVRVGAPSADDSLHGLLRIEIEMPSVRNTEETYRQPIVNLTHRAMKATESLVLSVSTQWGSDRNKCEGERDRDIQRQTETRERQKHIPKERGKERRRSLNYWHGISDPDEVE